MSLFGTDGARGIANVDLTIDLATKIARAAAKSLGSGARVLIGRDTRISGPMLEAALTAGFTASGVDVLLVGMLPTPALAYLISKMDCQAGVMISASHNPPQYNGIKLLDHQGRKWPIEQEELVEQMVLSGEFQAVGDSHIGRVFHYETTAIGHYLRYLESLFAGLIPELHVGLDLGHGAAQATAERVLRNLGVHVHPLFHEPEGSLINVRCGATDPSTLQDQVLLNRWDLGLAFDGDADRLIAVDHTGHIVDGDEILYVLATGLKQQGLLAQNTVVATVMSNLGLERALEKEGIVLERTPVGDRWVAQRMREQGFVLGGEQSGHVILAQYASTGDGLLTALALLAEIRRKNQSLAELVEAVERYPQILRNVRIEKTVAEWESIPGLVELVKEAEHSLGRDGRVFIRPSGTEPLLRIMVEGRDLQEITMWADRLESVVQHALESAKA
ncbi:phosphoglucosamine mutase [Sulfobacillus thermosulfidooxidans]|uniref:phosphoglucosamine mutase n=1 Tax=Sulfobacillus thermosulfidooxidans TaxID=28034 RepID=UPI0003F9D382|nr:phosphoglucosamine mutase [Sulfobacillus thermosulfidooxidans]